MPPILFAAMFLVAGALAGPRPPDAGGSVDEALRDRLEQMQAMDRPGAPREEVAARKALPVLYEEAGYQPLWTPERHRMLLDLLRESAEDGLSPEDYHLSELTRLAPVFGGAGADAVSRARADVLATDSFYLLLYHLYLGKVDPKTLDANWNFDPRPVGERGGVDFVLEALTKDRLREAVARVRPDHWWYARARAALSEYRRLEERGGWKPVPAGKTLKPGMKDPRVVALRGRLAVTGELSGQPLDSDSFDEPLAEAVRKFQARHRLASDGVVAAGTLAELNVPVAARILQIRLNLERARWVLHDIPEGEAVIVDLAGFEVAFLKKGEVTWRSRIQIGKPYNQTPIFKSRIDTVVFNPTWTIPPGIIRKETLPAIRRDPGYLQKKGLELIDAKGRKVDPAGVNWAAQNASSFPYMVRQPAGPDNALGRVKILFPNPYFVYLHDTPSKSLFEKSERAFSHGCMRTERPLELAELVLNDPENWDSRSIAQTVEAGETKTVRLKKPIPVLIMYWTIDPAGEGKTAFKRDPYSRDPGLARALDAPFAIEAPGRAASRKG